MRSGLPDAELHLVLSEWLGDRGPRMFRFIVISLHENSQPTSLPNFIYFWQLNKLKFALIKQDSIIIHSQK